ncbi:MAG: DUF1780 domain-containing protein [Verrucomicrobia bacterium]|nr:DUF1780 domain-containing protein [Verrucomicrobiota bacterium]
MKCQEIKESPRCTGPLYLHMEEADGKRYINENLFLNLQEAKRLVEEWREEYNERRPHSSLGRRIYNEMAREEEKLAGTSSLKLD